MMLTNNTYPFKFWCHKVLPLVYDDSLSYYEVLCKVAKDLQTVIEHDLEQDENIENLGENISSLEGAIRDLRGCIALEYDENNMYSEGMFCLMNDDLYICTESTTGEFDRNCWSHTDFGSQLKSTNDDITSVNNDITVIQRSLGEINEIIPEIQGSLTSLGNRIRYVEREIAELYDSNVTYSVGDYCIFNDSLQICTANTTGEFDSECWDRTNVTEELKDVKALANTTMNTLNFALGVFSANFAPAYDKTHTYAEGDYCTYQNVFYKCNTDNTTGNFDETYWDRVSVSTELGNGGSGGGNPIPAFDPTITYIKYSFVTYNDSVYMCITDNQTAGSFVVSEWVQMPVNNALESAYWQTIGDGMYSPFSAYKEGELVGFYDTNLYGDKMYTVAKASMDLDPYDTPAFTTVGLVSVINKLWRALSMFNVDTYDSTKTYNEGDIIINYVGECMKCTVNGTTGDYDFHNWTETDMFTELANLKKLVNDVGFYNETRIDRVSDNIVSQ